MEFTLEQLRAIARNAEGDEGDRWISELPDGTEFSFKVSELADYCGRLHAALIGRELNPTEFCLNGKRVPMAHLASAIPAIPPPEPWPEVGIAAPFDAAIQEAVLRPFRPIADPPLKIEFESDMDKIAGQIIGTSEIQGTIYGVADDQLRRRVMEHGDIGPIPAIPPPNEWPEAGDPMSREMNEEIRRAVAEHAAKWARGNMAQEAAVTELSDSGPQRPHESLVWAIMFASTGGPQRADNMLEMWRSRWPEDGE